jgi:formylglycine-generating enzyme
MVFQSVARHRMRRILILTAALGVVACRREVGDAAPPFDMVLIPGGTFHMGTAGGPEHEGPVHIVEIAAFYLDRHEVTVAEFGKFVAATGYRTESESFGWSGVFEVDRAGWSSVAGAMWRHPEGPESEGAADEPVTHVSWNDANAYARWMGKRLPSEAEWELAARGGLDGAEYVWGNELRPGGHPPANWWQGVFPERDTGEDGFRGRAPVGRFPANGFGLVDMAGNVWEWCADWYDGSYYARSPRVAPPGPTSGTERVLRGGSWMCSENFCTNYRPGARSHATPDTGLNNLGFRCVKDKAPS